MHISYNVQCMYRNQSKCANIMNFNFYLIIYCDLNILITFSYNVYVDKRLHVTRCRPIRMHFIVYYIVFAMRNNLQWSIAKRFRYFIIVLHCNPLSNNLYYLTGTRCSMHIDINMNLVCL